MEFLTYIPCSLILPARGHCHEIALKDKKN